jgi:hypothetical protein
MAADSDPFLDGDEPSGNWLNGDDPPRARHLNDDEFMMDSEPAPPPPIPSPELLPSVEHSAPTSTTKQESLNDFTAQQSALNIDSDDDIMIITPNRASPEARRKWSQQETQPRKSRVVGNNIAFIKEEPKEEDPVPDAPPVAKKAEKPKKDFEKIMAAQRALLKTMQSGGSSNGNGRSIFRSHTPNPFQNQAESSKRNDTNSVDHQYTSPKVTNNFREDPTQVDEAMRDGNEDHSWMHDESEADEEYEKLKTLHAALAKKEKCGRITSNERMELFKLEKTLQMKERLRAAALQRDAAAHEEEGEEGLFIPPESREDIVNRHRRNRPRHNSIASDEDVNSNFGSERNAGGEEDDEATFHKMLQQELNGDGLDGPGEPELTKSGKPRKKRAKAPKNAREVMEREEARRQQERSKAQKRKGRGSNANASSSRRKGAAAGASKGKGKATKKATKGGKKRGTVKNGESLLRSGQYRRYDGMDEIGQMMLEDMMCNDPISDRLQNPIFNVEPETPMPGQHNKETQFQKLFANIPNGDGSEANVKSVQNDKKALRDASRSFGYAQVKAQDGKWMIKGMRSTLYHHQLLGAQWMVQRELSSQPPHGGLLADSMG